MANLNSQGGGYVTPSEEGGDQTIPGGFAPRLAEVEDLSQNILTLVVISLVGIVIAVVIGVGAMVLDQLHTNEELYRQATGQKTVTTTKTVIIEQPLINNPN